MDEELQRWINAWKSMEVTEMKVMQQAQSAHRYEAVTRAVLWAALSLNTLLLVISVSASASALHTRWPELSMAAVALLVGVVALRIWGRQVAAARAQLTDTPLGMLVDLLSLRERELYWWVGRGPLRVTAAAVTGALLIAILRVARAPAADEAANLGWGALAFTLTSLLALACLGVARVRYLRREMASLRDIQRQLSTDEA